MDNKRIGFIGLGIMGRHMAAHLLNAGYPLAVYDISSDAMQNIVALGAKPGISCQDVAEQSDVVISMVPDSPDVEKVALGENGIIKAARHGLIYVDMSTISPETARKVVEALGEKGVRCLDAPVSGGETGAKNASLSIMVGGDEQLFNEMKPIFEVLGKTITLCGGSGSGQIVKACNQIQVAINIVGMSEALVFATKAGVDPAIVLKVLSGGYAQSRVMDVRGPKVIRREFEPGFKSRFHFKDLNIIFDTAKKENIPLPATAVAYQIFNALLAASGGDLDHTAIITVLEKLACVEVKTPQE
jgi:2-hydroxy-3-oxopropionate reductase